MSNLTGYGAYAKTKVPTTTFPPDKVRTEAAKYGIEDLPELPKPSEAIARTMTYLSRACAASIEFPVGSRFRTWEVSRKVYKVIKGVKTHVGNSTETHDGRNPNFSLKISLCEGAKTDASTRWEVNLKSHKSGGDMGHVLTVVYDPSTGLDFQPGVNQAAFEVYGADLTQIVESEYDRFLHNFDDLDMRTLLDKEYGKIQALRVLERLNCFVHPQHVERAGQLADFANAIGCEIDWSDLGFTERNKLNLLKQVRASIMADMDEVEKNLDKKLNTPTKERKRGEDQRARMYETACASIDHCMEDAKFHAEVLGEIAGGIVERVAELKAKALELLTKDFDAIPSTPVSAVLPPPVDAQPAPTVVDNPEEAF